jgi:hypothetical protein
MRVEGEAADESRTVPRPKSNGDEHNPQKPDSFWAHVMRWKALETNFIPAVVATADESRMVPRPRCKDDEHHLQAHVVTSKALKKALEKHWK